MSWITLIALVVFIALCVGAFKLGCYLEGKRLAKKEKLDRIKELIRQQQIIDNTNAELASRPFFANLDAAQRCVHTGMYQYKLYPEQQAVAATRDPDDDLIEKVVEAVIVAEAVEFVEELIENDRTNDRSESAVSGDGGSFGGGGASDSFDDNNDSGSDNSDSADQ